MPMGLCRCASVREVKLKTTLYNNDTSLSTRQLAMQCIYLAGECRDERNGQLHCVHGSAACTRAQNILHNCRLFLMCLNVFVCVCMCVSVYTMLRRTTIQSQDYYTHDFMWCDGYKCILVVYFLPSTFDI